MGIKNATPHGHLEVLSEHSPGIPSAWRDQRGEKECVSSSKRDMLLSGIYQ
jgi:hypothetical protein